LQEEGAGLIKIPQKSKKISTRGRINELFEKKRLYLKKGLTEREEKNDS